jgi:hypothetical protein
MVEGATHIMLAFWGECWPKRPKARCYTDTGACVAARQPGWARRMCAGGTNGHAMYRRFGSNTPPFFYHSRWTVASGPYIYFCIPHACCTLIEHQDEQWGQPFTTALSIAPARPPSSVPGEPSRCACPRALDGSYTSRSIRLARALSVVILDTPARGRGRGRGRPAGHVGRRDHPPPTSDTPRHRSWIGASNTVHASNAAAQLISVARAKPTYVLHAVRTPHLACHTAVQVCGAVRYCAVIPHTHTSRAPAH